MPPNAGMPQQQRMPPQQGYGGPPSGTRVMPESEKPLPSEYDATGHSEPPRMPPPREPKPRKRRGGPGRFFRWFFVFILIVILALGVLGWFAWSKIEKVDAIPEDHGSAVSDGRVYLLVGSDSRENLSEDERNELGTGSVAGKRTDTIMLLHLPTSGSPALISIPRDSVVEIPGHESGRINAAYAYGEAPLLVETIEANTGVAIDDYVEVGFGGFAGIVDALGGVEMCLDEAIEDEKAHIDLPAGCQNLEGKDALGYARARSFDGRGDLGRVERQRELMSAIVDKAKSPGTLLNPLDLTSSALAGGDALVLDENTGPLDMFRFMRGMMTVSSGGGETLTVPLGRVGNTVDWDTELSGQLWDALKTGSEIPKSVLDAQP